MRKVLILAFLISSYSFPFAQSLTTRPAKPEPGQKVILHYKPVEPVSFNENFYGIAYLLKGDLPVATDLDLSYGREGCHAILDVPEDAKAFFIRFVDRKGRTIDNNNGQGYGFELFSGDEPVQGAMAAMGSAFGSHSFILSIDRHSQKAMEFLKREFERYPQSAEDSKTLLLFASLVQRMKDAEGLNLIREQMQPLIEDKKADEEKLMLAYRLAKYVDENEIADDLENTIKRKFKTGQLVRQQLETKFYQEKDLSLKTEYFEELVGMGTESDNGDMISNLAYTMARSYDVGNLTEFDRYFAMIRDGRTRASLLNSMAKKLAGGDLEGVSIDLDRASRMASQALEYAISQLENREDKPSYYTDSQWSKSVNRGYAKYSDTYAMIEYRRANPEAALRIQYDACKAIDFEDAELNERYVIYHEDIIGGDATRSVIADLVQKGVSTLKMKDQLKRLYVDSGQTEQSFEDYLAALESEAIATHRAELAKNMINDDAPVFSLKNLNGEIVTLESLRGKVVLIDFWATWCGPCKAAFPGIQKAMEKYQSDEEVEFLFINSWERVENKTEVVRKFIDDNNYPFNVLMDESDEVIAKFEVEGMPTTFVLDKSGKIRFRKNGSSESTDSIFREVSLMIELAGKGEY